MMIRIRNFYMIFYDYFVKLYMLFCNLYNIKWCWNDFDKFY